mmetsp:Transcript_17063/g.42329  ORF Transcript_17063/g.42329 Transcript_17063/m.42329 type:complete len:201 (-) Transcript_17063:339-941(-)
MVSTPLQSPASAGSFMERAETDTHKASWYDGDWPNEGTLRYRNWSQCDGSDPSQGSWPPCNSGNDFTSKAECEAACHSSESTDGSQEGYICWGGPVGMGPTWHCQVPDGAPCDLNDECQGSSKCVNRNRVGWYTGDREEDPHCYTDVDSCCVTADNVTGGNGECQCKPATDIKEPLATIPVAQDHNSWVQHHPLNVPVSS